MYKHISLEEREQIAVLQAKGWSHRKMAKALGRKQSSISREVKRNKRHGTESLGMDYMPCKAQALADKRAIKQRMKAPLKRPKIFVYVREHLREPFDWTPEQIAGRLALDHPGSTISSETIYQYIYGKGKRYKLWQLLPLARKKRMKKNGRRVRRDGKIPGSVSIDLRPDEVFHRQIGGHWETDNLGGKVADRTAVSTTVERVSRAVFIDKLSDRTAVSKASALTDLLIALPAHFRQTMTTDNGAENTNYADVTAATNTAFYFCHVIDPVRAYHSWEKGTVENTNKLIRRFIPKSTSLDTVTVKQVKVIEQRLNNTPRKCLNFLTPYEKMDQFLKTQ